MKTILTGQPQQDDAMFAGKYLWSRCSTYIVIFFTEGSGRCFD
jgi:hypothetical protein